MVDNKKKIDNSSDSTKPLDSEFANYIGEVEQNLKDFKMKPKFFYKTIYNHIDFDKIRKITKVRSISPIEVYYKSNYEEFHNISKDDEKCSICLEMVYEFDKKTDYTIIKFYNEEMGYQYNVCLFEKCADHFFHTDCINNMIGSNNYIKCPICSKIYGKQTGTQPDGTITASILTGTKCSGFTCDTINVSYSFPNGSGYTGTSRTGYLPFNKDGMKILGLFKEAFDRKLLFTVGTSVTTGATNTTVWAGIHHKTALQGGSSSFGYPDETYFSRVQEELASKGVVEDSMDESPYVIAERFLGAQIDTYKNNSKKEKRKK